MAILETVVGFITGLVDRKAGGEMSKLRRNHQWPMVNGVVVTAIGVGMGMVDGGSETLAGLGLTEGQLADYITMAGMFLGGYVLTMFKRHAGTDEPAIDPAK